MPALLAISVSTGWDPVDGSVERLPGPFEWPWPPVPILLTTAIGSWDSALGSAGPGRAT